MTTRKTTKDTRTTWTARSQLIESFKKGAKKYSATELENTYGSREVWHEDGDRLRLVENYGDEAMTIYVFERPQLGRCTALERGCLDYEVVMTNMPIQVALDLGAAIKRS